MNLILQSPTLTPTTIDRIRELSGAMACTSLGDYAVRLEDPALDEHTRALVAERCDQDAIDFAFIRRGLKLGDFRVLAMDMDSTLINIECIDEIADAVGVKPQVAAITEAAMRGEITDFADSLRRRVALLEGVPAQALEDVYQRRLQLNPGAEAMLAAAQRVGLKTLLVSGGFTFFTDRLRDRLQLDEAHSNTLEIVDGKLTGRVLGDILDAEGKAERLRACCANLNVDPADSAIALGDGANDLKMMASAALSVAYHAKPAVRKAATHALSVSGLDGILNWFDDTAPVSPM